MGNSRDCVTACWSANLSAPTTTQPAYLSPWFQSFAEIGNYAAIDYTLNWLSENNIEEVFMFYSNLKNEIEEYCQTVVKGIDLKLRLNYMKPTELRR